MSKEPPDIKKLLPDELDNLRQQIDFISSSFNALVLGYPGSPSLAIERNVAERALHDVDMLKNLLDEYNIDFSSPTKNDISSVKEIRSYLCRLEGYFLRMANPHRDTLKKTPDFDGQAIDIAETRQITFKPLAGEEVTISINDLQTRLKDIQKCFCRLINTIRLYISAHDPHNEVPEPIERGVFKSARNPRQIKDGLSRRQRLEEQEFQYRPPPLER